MTATDVDGVAVVDDQPSTAPFRDRSGNPIYLRQTRVLTLADGSVVYGCAHCDYTSANVNSIRPHLGKHNGPRRAGATQDKPGGLNLPLTDLLKRLEQLDAITADRDEWKARAQSAERRLKQLRSALSA